MVTGDATDSPSNQPALLAASSVPMNFNAPVA
jgi:hypothetical protein